MPRLSELVNSNSEKTKSSESASKTSFSGVKLSQIASQFESASNPNQEKADSTAEKTRQFIGKIAKNAISPFEIPRQMVEGRLLADDPIEQATGEVITSAINTASFGIPKAIGKKIAESVGYKYPEIENKTSKTVGEIIGLLAPAKLAVSVAGKIPLLAGRTVVQAAARGTAEGAAIGFTTSPDEFTNIEQRIKQAKVGAAIGAVAVPISKGIENLGRVAFKARDFAQKVRSTLFESKTSIGKQFESQLDNLIQSNPSKVISLQEPFERLNTMATENSRLISDFRSGAKKAGVDVDLIEGFIKNPESASQMTLNQTRDIKKAINNIPSIKKNLKKGKFADFSDTDIDLLDFVDEVKSKQLGVFPELEQINKNYSDKLSKYNAVKDKFRVGKLLDNIERNFGDAEVKSIIKELLPKQVIQEMGGFRMAAKFLKTMGWVAATGVTGAALTAGGTVTYKALQ